MGIREKLERPLEQAQDSGTPHKVRFSAIFHKKAKPNVTVENKILKKVLLLNQEKVSTIKQEQFRNPRSISLYPNWLHPPPFRQLTMQRRNIKQGKSKVLDIFCVN